jgi:hypothetical protein
MRKTNITRIAMRLYHRSPLLEHIGVVTVPATDLFGLHWVMGALSIYLLAMGLLAVAREIVGEV